MQWEGNYARNLGPALRDPESTPSASLWSYIDGYDLADALRLAAEAGTHGHEVVYIASPDNLANRIDVAVRRILRTMFAFGVFDRPAYANDESQIPLDAHAKTARRIEEGGITLRQEPQAHAVAVHADREYRFLFNCHIRARSWPKTARSISCGR